MHESKRDWANQFNKSETTTTMTTTTKKKMKNKTTLKSVTSDYTELDLWVNIFFPFHSVCNEEMKARMRAARNETMNVKALMHHNLSAQMQHQMRR